MVDLTVIVVSWKVRDLLLDCLATLPAGLGSLSSETIVVDNASGDGTVEGVREKFPEVRVIANSGNLGFSKANNLAIRDSESRYVLLLNPDTLLEPECLQRVVAFMDSCPGAAAATSAVYCPDGRPERYMGGGMPAGKRVALAILQRAIRLVPFGGIRGRLTERQRDWYVASMDENDTRPRPIRGIEGAFFLARRDVIERVGLLDEEFFFGLELTEWSLRIRRSGGGIYIVPGARIVHLGGRSAAQLQHKEAEPWVYRQFYHFKYAQGGEIGLRGYHLRTLLGLGIQQFIHRVGGRGDSARVEELRGQGRLFREAYRLELSARRKGRRSDDEGAAR